MRDEERLALLVEDLETLAERVRNIGRRGHRVDELEPVMPQLRDLVVVIESIAWRGKD